MLFSYYIDENCTLLNAPITSILMVHELCGILLVFPVVIYLLLRSFSVQWPHCDEILFCLEGHYHLFLIFQKSCTAIFVYDLIDTL